MEVQLIQYRFLILAVIATLSIAKPAPIAANEGNAAYMDATISDPSPVWNSVSGVCNKPSFGNRIDDAGGTFWGLQALTANAIVSAGFQVGQYLSTTASFQGPVVPSL